MIWIAEIGVNHHGDFEKAKRMVLRAKECGATYAKGQYYDPEKVLGKDHEALEYAKQCQFTKQQHEELGRFGNSIGIRYFVSVFNVRDVGWSSQFGAMKIASRMNQNQEFISKVNCTYLPVFMSVQPTTMVRHDYRKKFKLMWCVREYPTPKDELYKYPYTSHLGLSSHCPDWTGSYDAWKAGARVIENHVCESRNEQGCDIPSSLTFDEYKRLISSTLARI